MPDLVEFRELVDGLLQDCARERVPILPSAIADALATIFYWSEQPADYLEYRLDLERFIRSRLRFLSGGRAN